jgi:hypothetical protein
MNWLFEQMYIFKYEIVLFITGWVITSILALILEYKYLNLRKKKRE